MIELCLLYFLSLRNLFPLLELANHFMIHVFISSVFFIGFILAQHDLFIGDKITRFKMKQINKEINNRLRDWLLCGTFDHLIIEFIAITQKPIDLVFIWCRRACLNLCPDLNRKGFDASETSIHFYLVFVFCLAEERKEEGNQIRSGQKARCMHRSAQR